MSEKFLIENARNQFILASVELIGLVEKVFPNCEDTKEASLVLRNVTCHSESKKDEAIKSWYEHLTTCLDKKQTKYAKAVERLSGSAVIYHAMVYRDIDALRINMKSGVATQISLWDKWNDPQFQEKDKEIAWNLIDMMNSACYKGQCADTPSVPTRTQIQENIKATRKTTPKSDATSSMLIAFRDDINELCELWKQDPVLSDDAITRSWMERWSKLSTAKENDVTTRDSCVARDGPVVVKQLRCSFPELQVPDDLCKKSWELIVRLNDVSTVVDSVPMGMMSQIESMANQLAQDMQSGKLDMSNVDLSQIGEKVLANCSESDMSNFAGSIEKLMPVVQSMTAQNKM